MIANDSDVILGLNSCHIFHMLYLVMHPDFASNFKYFFLQSVMEYEEHEKRAWSVDFSQTEPSMLVSGSDDCKVL